LAVALALALPATATACSNDGTTYLDPFLDSACLQPPLTNTTIDALGGLRLSNNGVAVTSSWDTDTDFSTGISYQSKQFGPVGASTLSTTGTGSAAALTLPTTLVPLSRDGANPVLSPTASSAQDNDNVDDPSVVRIGSTYDMWYSGTAEDGSGPAIFEATSSDGKTWVRANGGNPVLTGSAGAFDAHGVFAPEVVYDPMNALAPYKMWYAGRGDVFGAIGYATSTDGVTWTKYNDPATPATTDPVLDHGRAGSPDSFAASDPSVLFDGTGWKMWYTADDSNTKEIAYATSSDGIVWNKGGVVISPASGGNTSAGTFAPTVYKLGPNSYQMVFTGRKTVSQSPPQFQTKLINATSSDGISWNVGSIALNTFNNGFDSQNLNAPFVLADPTDNSAKYKLYYSGNAVDAEGNLHERIGLATGSNGTSFNRFGGSGTGGSVLDISPLTAAEPFDGRFASGLNVVTPAGSTPKYVGFYWGDRGFDFLPRLGEATSPDATTWSKIGGGSPLFALGNGFDAGGDRDPSVLLAGSSYDLFFTGLSSSGTQSIGLSTSTADGTTKLPTTWAAQSQLLAASGSGFDASGVSHPSVVNTGAGGTPFSMYYTATDSSGNQTIGLVTSASATSGYGGRTQVLTPGAAGTFDHNGVKDPVVIDDGGTFRMLYTGIETITVPGPLPNITANIERIGYATSPDGTTWTKRGPVLNPSDIPYADNESGAEPTGMLIDGSTLQVFSSGIDRTGRLRGDHETTAYPLASTPQAGVPNGWSTYQLGDDTTTIQEFRSITGTGTGSGIELWMSFLQPYSSSGSDFWSDWFPVTATNATQMLNFLNTVRGVRWQARLAGPAGSPSLDRIDIVHAPVSYFPSGSATTTAIAAPTGHVTLWGTLMANTTKLAPAGGGTVGGTVTVFDPAAPATALASSALNANGTTTIALGGISAAAHPSLGVRFDLTGDGTATPLVHSLQVTYNGAVGAPGATTGSASAIAFNAATVSGSINPNGQPTTYSFQYGPTPAYGLTSAAVSAGSGTTAAATSARLTGLTPSTTYHFRIVATSPAGTAVGADQTFTTLPPPRLTLTAPHSTTYGKRVALSGTLKEPGGAPVAAQTVTLLQKPAGARVFTALGNAKTTATGSYTLTAKPTKSTVYEATVTGATNSPTAKIGVHQLVALTVVRRGGKGYFKGRISPSHPKRAVTIQIFNGGRWKTFARLKSSRRSSFSTVKALKPNTKYRFRAVTPADSPRFLNGTSRIASVRG
jgi:predicted GH43/DUF377 family glycosyl hydrolase